MVIHRLSRNDNAGNEKDTGRVTINIEEAARQLGISRASAYNAANRGDIPVVKIGKRLLVPRAALERLLAGETR